MSGTTPQLRKRDVVRRLCRRLFGRSREPSSSITTTQTASQAAPQASSHNQQQLGERFFHKALEILAPEVQAKIREFGHDDITSAIDSALAAADEKRRICEAKRWTWLIHGRQVRLQDLVDKTIFWLDRFKAAGDVAVNADPIHAGLPWAGVRLILEVRRHYCTL